MYQYHYHPIQSRPCVDSSPAWLQGRWQDAWQLFTVATSPGSAMPVDDGTVQLLTDALLPHLPSRVALGSAAAAPLVGALQHLVHVALGVHTPPPPAAVAPLLDALVQRGDWRAAVVLIGNIVQAHGAGAARAALQELPGLLAAAERQVQAEGGGAEAQQLHSAAGLVRCRLQRNPQCLDSC